MNIEQKKEAAFKFIREHEAFKLKVLAKECKINYSVLHHAYEYSTPLKEEHINSLYDRLKHYGLK